MRYLFAAFVGDRVFAFVNCSATGTHRMRDRST